MLTFNTGSVSYNTVAEFVTKIFLFNLYTSSQMRVPLVLSLSAGQRSHTARVTV